MAAGWDLVQWITLGVIIVGNVLALVFWSAGCVMAARRRPAPGAMLLMTGFSLFALVELVAALLTTQTLLAYAGIVDMGPR